MADACQIPSCRQPGGFLCQRHWPLVPEEMRLQYAALQESFRSRPVAVRSQRLRQMRQACVARVLEAILAELAVVRASGSRLPNNGER